MDEKLLLLGRQRARQATTHERRWGVYQHAPETFAFRPGYQVPPRRDPPGNRAALRALRRPTAIEQRTAALKAVRVAAEAVSAERAEELFREFGRL